MRGGYRPGAGRKKGQKDIRPRKGSGAYREGESIKKMLTNDLKVKARFYQEYLIRVSKGEKLSVTEKKLMDKLAGELAASMDEGKPKTENPEILDPLTYMLKVMNDPDEDKEMRARMAIAAAPYTHPRKGEGAGKKDERADRAKRASEGKFAAGKAPVRLVK